MLDVNWQELLVPRVPLLEIVVRGAVTYLALYALLRLLRRQAGSISTNDLLVLVLISDAAQSAMAPEYRSMADGILLVAVIVGVATAMNWLGYHVPWIDRIVHPAAVRIVDHGVADRGHLRHYLVSDEELLTQLRLQGVASIEEVQAAYVEGNGQVSVLTEDHQARGVSEGRPAGS